MELQLLLEKLEILETRQAFQEDTIESLNKVLIVQQKDIEQLTIKLGVLQERVKQTTDTLSDIAVEEPPPPHY